MNFKRVFFATACLGIAALNFSCETKTVSEQDELQIIEKDSILIREV